jgi:hypothetical protein
VAFEAGRELRLRVGRAVHLERLILPVAVADLVGDVLAPTGALFHHGVADDFLGAHEASVRAFHRFAFVVHLGGVLRHRQHRAVGQRLAGLGGVDRGLAAGIEQPHLLEVGAVDRLIEHALGVVGGEYDQVAALGVA